MYLNKYPHTTNFRFPEESEVENNDSGWLWKAPTRTLDLDVISHGGDVYSITVKGFGWEKNHSQVEWQYPENVGNSCSKLKPDGAVGWQLENGAGEAILETLPTQPFGICGDAHIFQFIKPEKSHFYGMGEKMFGLERSKIKTKFWNTDVWADFAPPVCSEGNPDPYYVSVPYVIMGTSTGWVGLLLDNPEATFVLTDTHINIANQMDAAEQTNPSLQMGSQGGQPRLVMVVGESLADLTRKFQRLIGTTPLPPAWALGYQQCRWGYESIDDLRYLHYGMKRNEIPCDGLWLDIEYMHGYRVFTFEGENFPNPVEDVASIQGEGRRVVPIIDPGVKVEASYSVYESGKQASCYCKNPEGFDYVGMVWPGETAFPDFSLPEVREWWASQVQQFAKTGITAAWLDMNDPSTGPALNEQMLFNQGTLPHATYHNQYANGMAQATHAGFLAERPEERPFLLSRSGYTGIGRYSAIWTGDNFSNRHYLKASIPCSINLALSGVPFNGPDVGGFGGDANSRLIQDWIKACFLFPFLRNHSTKGSRDQEPWAFDGTTTLIFRRFVQARYRLRLYLYQLFIDQEEQGEAILRPLFYDFPDQELGFETLNDAFMVGPSILQAPILEEEKSRSLVLPRCRWFDLQNGRWVNGGQQLTIDYDERSTPIYLRHGHILPIARNQGDDHGFHSREVDLHVVLDREEGSEAILHYRFDDGLSFDYQQGKRSVLSVSAKVEGGCLKVNTSLIQNGYGDADVALVVYDYFDAVELNGKPVSTTPLVDEWFNMTSTTNIQYGK